MLKEGFWDYKNEPKSEPKTSGWTRDGLAEKFAKMLMNVQVRARKRHYKGWSTCRICGCKNGSAEFSYKNVIWPSGLMHYITDHNVRPSNGFIRFIMKEIGY